jgi:hypothetical protein
MNRSSIKTLFLARNAGVRHPSIFDTQGKRDIWHWWASTVEAAFTAHFYTQGSSTPCDVADKY